MRARIGSVLIVWVTLFTAALGSNVGHATKAQASTEPATQQTSKIPAITSANAHSILPRDVWQIDGIPLDLRFSPDGTILAAGQGGGTIELWNAISRTQSAILKGHTEAVNSVVFSPDGTLLASASQDKTVRLWSLDRASEKFVLKGHSADVKNLSFSSDGKYLVSSGVVEAILWDVSTGTQKVLLRSGAENTPYLSKFSPTGSLLAVGYHSTIDVWDVRSSQIQETLECPGYPQDIAFSSDGRTLACVTSSGDIHMWDLVTKKELVSFQVDGGEDQLVIDPTGKNLVVVGSTISLWNIATQRQITLPSYNCNFVSNAEFNFDGSVLAYGGYCAKEEHGFIEMDNVTTGQELVRRNTEGLIWNVTFSPKSTLFASGEGGRITIWSP